MLRCLRCLRSKLFHGVTSNVRHTAAAAVPPHYFLPFQAPKPYWGAPAVEQSVKVQFLQNSCGLPPDTAAVVAKRAKLKVCHDPNGVLALLRDYGFSSTQITDIVSRVPRILVAHPTRILKPAMDFFLTKADLSRSDLPKVLTRQPWLLFSNAKERLAPNIAILRSTILDEAVLLHLLRQRSPLLRVDIRKLPSRVEALRNHGVPDPLIWELFTDYLVVFLQPRVNFDKNLERAKALALRPSSPMFTRAFWVFYSCPQRKWDVRMGNFKRLGWSEPQVIRAFIRFPFIMSASVDNIRAKLKFFQEKLRWTPEYISSSSAILSASMEKRILPRSLILRILASKGLVSRQWNANHFHKTNQRFVDMHVKRHQDVLRLVPHDTKIRFLSYEINLGDSLKLLQAGLNQ